MSAISPRSASRQQTETTVALADASPAFSAGLPRSLRTLVFQLIDNRRYAEAETTARQWLEREPRDTDIWNELSVSLYKQGRLAEAESLFEHALKLDPNHEALWTNFGHLLTKQRRYESAIAAYRAALALIPNAFDPLMGIGLALSNQWKPEEATPYLTEALRQRPQSVEALQNFAMNLGRMRRWHEAIHYYEAALRHRNDLAVIHRNLAVAYLMVGDYKRGWPEYEWRLTFNPNLGCRINRTFWNGDNFPNQTILLHSEQGLGDVLQFIRYAPLVKQRGGRVVVLCPAPLLSLLERCDGVDQVYDGSGHQPDCQIHAPLMSLPSIFATTLETIPSKIPYLHPDPARVTHWQSVLAKAIAHEDQTSHHPSSPPPSADRQRPFLIGVAWQGNPENPTDSLRSFPFAHLEPLARIPRVRLVNLQVGAGLEQLTQHTSRFQLIDLPGRLGRDFAETAAIVSLLDLVIAPDTALAHLAAGLGLRTWLPLSAASEWRWLLDRQDSPWYPTIRLFRQSTLGHWPPLFVQMAQTLKSELALAPPGTST